ncbi:MAG TPA: hypothetical protein VGX24_02850 [Pyrinomonadaceae bacterium]|jgi:hypothetical protein|nr:hypothetical protein [Pyrinomonadaceae bacterium]
MKNFSTSLLLSLLIAHQAAAIPSAARTQEAAKIIQPSQETVARPILGNADVLALVKAALAPDVIITKIKSSACNFETTPAALEQLKAGGVPEAVIAAMLAAPGASVAPETTSTRGVAPTQEEKEVAAARRVKLPQGTPLDIEMAYTITSQEVRAGELISFRVVNPVLVDGVIVVAVGATATARIVKASRGGHFGRAGRIAWVMQDVTAVDGTRIPLASSAGRIVGDSKGAKVVTQMIITGALLPLVAPVALLHGFKRGENAIIPAGKRFEASVSSDATVLVKPSR